MTDLAPARAPTVVIAMPTYNHARFVSEAVESVLAQTFPAWELIIVDDGSTDETLDIISRYRDPRIRVIPREHVGLSGIGTAYETIREQSSAPLVAILEGDDRWPPDKLERQVTDFDGPGVVLSYGAGWLIDECGCEYGRVAPFAPDVRSNRPIGAIVPSLLTGNPILSPTVMVRRTALESVGGFWQPDGVPYVDHPTWLLLAMEGAFAYNDEVVGSWRRHSVQWTTRRVHSKTSVAPEELYLDAVVERYRRRVGRSALPGGQLDSLRGRLGDRNLLNRWRLALLTATPREIATMALDLVRTRRLRPIGMVLVGGALWAAGSDLEWIQRRRERVAWPSRRHRHVRPCAALEMRSQAR